jgi:hypothetical protein
MHSTKKCAARTPARIRSASEMRADGGPQVAEAVAPRAGARHRLEVVLEHEALGRRHRRARLVLVGAAGERQQLPHPLDDAVGRLAGRQSRRCSVDAELFAQAAEDWPVRRLVPRAQHLPDELVLPSRASAQR